MTEKKCTEVKYKRFFIPYEKGHEQNMIFLTKFILVAGYNNVGHIMPDDYFPQKLFHEKEREMDDNYKVAIIALRCWKAKTSSCENN